MYFKTREIEEEDKEDDYSDSNSSSDDEGEEKGKTSNLRNCDINFRLRVINLKDIKKGIVVKAQIETH
jgi:hypothetical protein